MCRLHVYLDDHCVHYFGWPSNKPVCLVDAFLVYGGRVRYFDMVFSESLFLSAGSVSNYIRTPACKGRVGRRTTIGVFTAV